MPPLQRIAPSIMSADLMDLRRIVSWVTHEHEFNWVHVEVMDGHFVPNLTVGPAMVTAIRTQTGRYIDVHLMVSDPFHWLQPFKEAGASGLTFHAEAFCKAPYDPAKSYCGPNLDELQMIVVCAWKIKALGMRAGLALRPQTPLSVVQAALSSGAIDLLLVLADEPGASPARASRRAEGDQAPQHVISKVRDARDAFPGLDIEVDGQLVIRNIKELSSAGANVFVVGSKIFDSPNSEKAIRDIRTHVYLSRSS